MCICINLARDHPLRTSKNVMNKSTINPATSGWFLREEGPCENCSVHSSKWHSCGALGVHHVEMARMRHQDMTSTDPMIFLPRKTRHFQPLTGDQLQINSLVLGRSSYRDQLWAVLAQTFEKIFLEIFKFASHAAPPWLKRTSLFKEGSQVLNPKFLESKKWGVTVAIADFVLGPNSNWYRFTWINHPDIWNNG